ncbi:hypothetical protein ABEY62_17950 [Priestia megaterium]
MLNLNKNPRFTKKEREMLESLKPHNKKTWEIKTNRMKKLKSRLRKKLDILQQGRCAYCGNQYGITSAMELEHIAPKGDGLYPEFVFHEKNLLGSCELCNGVYKKHSKDVVEVRSTIYEQCQFKLVHPYLDNPDDHFQWDNERILIAKKTNKGKYSIDLFELNSVRLTSERTKSYYLNKLVNGYALSDSDKERLKEAMKYHPM